MNLSGIRRWATELGPIAWLAAAAHVALHLATAWTWPLFRDELYYLACADHLDWGYVDHPPLSIVALAVVRAVLGDGVLGLRLVPALLGGVLVLQTADLAGALGGRGFARGLAAVAVAIVPLFLGITGYWSMNAFDLVIWAGLARIVVWLVDRDDPRGWIAFGALAGIGLEVKLSVLFFGAGAAVALVVTPLRRHLATPWPWLGAALAGLLFAPHLAWQVHHGWPTLEFVRNAQEHKITAIGPAGFALESVLAVHPVLLPLWVAGLAWAARGRYRALAVIFVTVVAVLLIQRSKPYYLGPAYPMLLAAGAVPVEQWVRTPSGLRRAARVGLLAGLVAAGLVTAPFAVPVLPVERFLAYQAALGQSPRTDENHAMGPLPQFFADRLGWEALAETVGGVVRALPERDRVVVVAGNYGEAGALDHYGRDLPPVVSLHNSYWFWGPPAEEPQVVVTVGIPRRELEPWCAELTEAARLTEPYAMPYETDDPIFVCRGLRVPIREVWARKRRFI